MTTTPTTVYALLPAISPAPPPLHPTQSPPFLEVADTPAYLRYCDRVHQLHGHLPVSDRFTAAFVDLAAIGNTVWDDPQALGVVNYVWRRLEEAHAVWASSTVFSTTTESPMSTANATG